MVKFLAWVKKKKKKEGLVTSTKRKVISEAAKVITF